MSARAALIFLFSLSAISTDHNVRTPISRGRLRVRLDKTQSEHNGSASLPIADIGPDIDLRSGGPGTNLGSQITAILLPT
jgi:hypothetical protein